MSGTTLCPHCNTRFRIAEPQLEAHQGMVRCGHCLQAFDARPGYIPDQPNPQLELPILDEPAEILPAEAVLSREEAAPPAETSLTGETLLVPETEPAEAAPPVADTNPVETALPASVAAETEAESSELPPAPRDDLLDFSPPTSAEPEEAPAPTPDETNEPLPESRAQAAVEPAALTLAEQVVIVQDEEEPDREPAPEYRRWPWAVASVLLLLMLLAQTAYFLRVDLAARLPGLKPALIAYCQLLGCSVPLPQVTDLMSIESSELEADPVQINQITLNALLRNRAPYAQAFPQLELSLNDTQDKPLARRIFKPKDYLPPHENEQTGMQANHELSIKLYLGTADLRPTGYRLVLLYP